MKSKSELRRLSYQLGLGASPRYQSFKDYEESRQDLIERLEMYLIKGWSLDSTEINNVLILLKQSQWIGD